MIVLCCAISVEHNEQVVNNLIKPEYHQMTRELLTKFLDNRCSSDELEQVVQWINEDAFKKAGKELAFNDWMSFQEEDSDGRHDEQLQLLLDKIHHRINIEACSVKPEPRTRYRQIVTWLTRVAAMLLIPTLIVVFLNRNSGHDHHLRSYSSADMVVDSLEILASVGARTVVQLTDGTEVHLNYGSKIKYPRSFDENTREVTLQGEGFFSVAHDPSRPFVVKTKQLDIKALGTKFNVQAYPEDEFIATTLVEGKVVVTQAGGGEDAKTVRSLKPGQHINYNVNTQTISSTTGNIEKYIVWKDGVLMLDNTDLKEVAEKLERNFNVEIQVSDAIKDYTYTVKFVDEPLYQILDLLTKATPIQYKILPRRKLPDGTFLKQKIVFEKR